MGGFDAGALIFNIKTVGAQLAKQDLLGFDQAAQKTGRSTEAAGKQTDQLGTATDTAGKKSRAAKQPLDEQANSTKRVGDESKNAKPKQEDQAAASEKQARSAGQLSIALLAAGVAVTALVGLSVAKFASFDQAMSNTAAATMATTAEQEKLGEAALDAGADTAYSANEAAAAEEELAKAGLSVSEVIGGGLNASLALAAAGQLEVARSATVMATTLKQFKLPAEDAAHVSDLLAAGAGKAQGSVEDLANALKFVGPVANGLGLSLEETTGILALFAEQGIIGEQAGTSLRGVLSSLTSPSALAASEMKKYNVEIFDANGKMKSGAAVAQELHKAFNGLSDAERSQAMGRIFGNEQITAATILMRGGAKAVDEWTDSVNDSGFAAQQAAMRQDNLAGDIEKLGGAFDTALIKTGSGANDVLRDMVQTITLAVDGYGELDPAVQSIALVLGVATGAMLLFSGGALGAVSKFAELKVTLEAANISMGKTALIAGGAGLALAGIATVIALVASAQADARAKAQAYGDTLEEGTNKATKATRELAKENLAAEQSYLWISRGSAYDAAEKLGLSLDTVTDAAMGNADALRELEQVITAGSGSQVEAQKIADELGISLVDVSAASTLVAQSVLGEASSFEKAVQIAEQKNKVTEEGVPITESAAAAYIEAADGAGDLKSELEELVGIIMEANGIGQDAISANLDYADALAGVDEYIQKARDGVDGYSLTLDQSTEAGRENLGMLNDMAADSQKAADAQFALDGNTANYKATLEAGRQALIDRATSLGMNADEAGVLADQIYRIPSATEWEVIAKTAAATTSLENFLNTYQGRTIEMTVRATNGNYASPADIFKKADGGQVRFFANGGENHVAQFARAGDWRVWAEPETGGEWYLPDAPAKRAQSVSLAEQMLDGWGYDMVPRGGRDSVSARGGSFTLEQHVHGTPGMNEDQLAKKAAREAVKILEEKLR
ncbi:phage tail tape measure protein [Streptomyces sp. NPDC058650]|uniref:phage tail tape measure protein n=1 Tax=Streptomyces sp. NPDC058650 TaxID=3346575 RepID=UPI003655DAC3